MINKIKEMYKQQGISEQVYDFSEKICADLEERFKKVDKIAEYNQLKVIGAMQKNKVAEAHFNTTTGYGYNDLGRETLEKVYADVFHTEDALVRPQITCGTHALALALSANLRPNDKLVYISGKPYDTLEEVIGIRPSNGSLAEYGVKYDQVDLLENGEFDFEGIKEKITNDVKVVGIQRSKGYATRPTLSVEKIGQAIKAVKEIHFFRCVFQNILYYVFYHCFCKFHVICKVCKSYFRFNHPKFCCVSCCVRIFGSECWPKCINLLKCHCISFAI